MDPTELLFLPNHETQAGILFMYFEIRILVVIPESGALSSGAQGMKHIQLHTQLMRFHCRRPTASLYMLLTSMTCMDEATQSSMCLITYCTCLSTWAYP